MTLNLLRLEIELPGVDNAFWIISWKPVPGTYTISSIDAGGTIIDTVHFKVKGN